ncbi:class I SAM-dependent methyltransferase [Caballeronia sp. LZ062]|uniref:class I SAM-dependent methyltransferase n=1 Tax=unclassified Caballeronia TaxID=2646786 RepID=UPI00285B3ACE|nr:MULTISPECIES: class I SAM-dependent methyltransferase [unclassified Caballeronia]MDR5855206.1 class I SAM-dependent methyltransferase [Caballeronia sp. LZ050]MDR5870265.1 class I SAM-dependent methyltransferase [Caballeronia sp. LZ062]
MSGVNHDYWQGQVGAAYRRQQEGRTALGNANYREQEAWVAAHLKERSERLGRPVEVLDFGCGFGRMARALAPLPFVAYHGYDFSAEMTRELLDDPPAGFDASHAVRVAPSAPEAFGGRRFDIVFTVSVLIHNAQEDASRLISDMASLLKPDGYLLLIENQMVPFELKENNWHAGCWLHDYVGDLARAYDIDVFHGQIPDHDVYLVRPSGTHGRNVRIIDREGVARPLADDERLRLSLPRLRVALKGLESELEHRDVASVEGQLHDVAEQSEMQSRVIAEQRRQIEEQQKLITALSGERDTLARAQRMRMRLQRTLMQAHAEAPLAPDAVEAGDDSAQKSFERAFPHATSFEWQAIRDTMYANADERFACVCHIFHEDWVGMRSAVGALPGWKLSIPSANPIPIPEIERIIALLEEHGVRKLVLHGISDPMYGLSRALASTGFDQQYLVWHGTTTQWVWDDERRFAHRAIQMARDGEVRRFSAIRRGLGPIVGERNFAPQLVNMPPRFASRNIAGRTVRHERCHALAPSWNDLRKNLATNVLAAQCVDRVEKVHVVAKNFDLPKWLAPKVTKAAYRDHTSMLEMMASMDIVLNVTTIDCHPMVDLESMSVGTPCVRGPLFLDGLEDHAYVRLTAVDNPMSVDDVRRRIDEVLSVGASELQDVMSDYRGALLELSRARYLEFLEI